MNAGTGAHGNIVGIRSPDRRSSRVSPPAPRGVGTAWLPVLEPEDVLHDGVGHGTDAGGIQPPFVHVLQRPHQLYAGLDQHRFENGVPEWRVWALRKRREETVPVLSRTAFGTMTWPLLISLADSVFDLRYD